MHREEDPSTRHGGPKIAHAINITIILPSGSKTFRQFNSNKNPGFPSDITQKLDGPVHFARDIDFIPDGQVERVISFRVC